MEDLALQHELVVVSPDVPPNVADEDRELVPVLGKAQVNTEGVSGTAVVGPEAARADGRGVGLRIGGEEPCTAKGQPVADRRIAERDRRRHYGPARETDLGLLTSGDRVEGALRDAL